MKKEDEHMIEDRRVRKTKKAIHDVFCELTKEKKLNEITIKELCAQADINKSTFYLHYRDIYDLANSIQSSFVEDVCNVIREYPYNETIEKAPEIWQRVAKKYFRDSNDIGMLLRRPGMQSMGQALERGAIDAIMNKFVAAGMAKDSEDYFHHHLYVTFVINGYVGVLREFDVSEMEAAMIEVSKRISTGFVVEIH
ncbi:MAG: TetR/AcrR family transcriptional regulator [Lachnospiraceae bacterium]|nr:TetR/AcrR family transcriptional regulator [Lachnospiraceae bacterium]